MSFVMGEQDVTIVGAGLAGLMAARVLDSAGLRVRVLEARERVGGRTCTITGDVSNEPAANQLGVPTKTPVDLGGQWVGPTQHRVLKLINELGLSTFQTFHTGRKCLDDRGRLSTYRSSIPRVSPLALLELHSALNHLDRLRRQVPLATPWAEDRARMFDGISLEAWKRRNLHNPTVRGLIDALTRVVFGTEPSEISLLYFLFYIQSGGGLLALTEIPEGAQEQRVVGGTQQLAQGLAAQLPEGSVVVGAPVQAIDQTAERVVVTSTAGVHEARACIVAVPPALTARIVFDPSLPAVRAQLNQRMPQGSLIKCIITYSRAWWREAGFSGEVVSTHGPLCFVCDNTDDSGQTPALVAFIGGDAAREFAAVGAQARRDMVVQELVRCLGPQAADPTGYIEKNWSADPWAQGCPVGVMGAGNFRHFAPALRQPVGRLFWAGTETAMQWCGYMEGALESGERAATEVLALLQRQ